MKCSLCIFAIFKFEILLFSLSENKYHMHRLLEDFIEDIEDKDIEIQSSDDSSEKPLEERQYDYDWMLIVDVEKRDSFSTGRNYIDKMINKFPEVRKYEIVDFNENESSRFNMYNSDHETLILMFSLSRKFKSPAYAFRFIYFLSEISIRLRYERYGNTSQYMQLMINYKEPEVYTFQEANHMCISKPCSGFTRFFENILEGKLPKSYDSSEADSWRHITDTIWRMCERPNAGTDYFLNISGITDRFCQKFSKLYFQSAKKMKMSKRSMEFLEGHSIDADAMFSMKKCASIYCYNSDGLYVDTFQKGFSATCINVWDDGWDNGWLETAKEVMSKQSNPHLMNVMMKYDTVEYSYMGAGHVELVAYLGSALVKINDNKHNTPEMYSVFLKFDHWWTQLDVFCECLSQLLNEELPEYLIEDIMRIPEERGLNQQNSK